ncbi:MAG: helix-hairpin-helix domain-containing protein [bacterium]|jgi:DNA uptake protein ComE-like DNA-binding protein
MNFREHLAVFLSFSKKERKGIYLLLSICILLWILPVFFSSEKIPEDILTMTPLEINEAKHLLQSRTDYAKAHRKHNDFYAKHKFAGSFRSVSDSFKKQVYRKKAFSERNKTPLDINSMDSAALEKLPGIGEKLSSRIIRYRERLGGFVSLSQLSEVYGLSDSVMQRIAPLLFVSDQFQPTKIDINKAEYTDFRKHPYFTHTIVKSMLVYRKANGPFISLEDMQRIISIERDEITKITPYLSLGN